MAEIRSEGNKGLNLINYKCTICEDSFYKQFYGNCVTPPEPEITTSSIEVRLTVYKALGIPVPVPADQSDGDGPSFFKEFKEELPLCLGCCFYVGCLNNIRKQMDYFDKEWNELKSILEESIQKSVDSRRESNVDRENDCDMDSLNSLLDPSRLAESLRNSEVQILRQIVYQRRHHHLTAKSSSSTGDGKKSDSPMEPQNEYHPQPQDIANEGLGKSPVATAPNNNQFTQKVRLPSSSLNELDKKLNTIRKNYSHRPLTLISLLKSREPFSKKIRSASADPEGVDQIHAPDTITANSEVAVSVSSNETGGSGENRQDVILPSSSSGSASDTQIRKNSEIRPKKNSQGKFECPYCHQMYSGLGLNYFKKHVKMHTVVAPQSVIGTKTLPNPHGQAQQIKSHSEKKNSFPCGFLFCSASFETKNQLYSHAKNHEKPLHCNHCGKGYKNQACLTIHVHRFHSRQK